MTATRRCGRCSASRRRGRRRQAANGAIRKGGYGPQCDQYLNALQQWTADMQARSNELNQKIWAFNNDLGRRMVEDWYVIDATRTTTQTTVQNSTPGRILVGGNLTLSGPAGSVTNNQ